MYVQRRTISIAAALISGIMLAAAPIASDLAEATPRKTHCNTTISDTTIEGDLFAVPADRDDPANWKCTLHNVRVKGSVVVEPGSYLDIESFSRIAGNVTVPAPERDKPNYVQLSIMDSRVAGAVLVEDARVWVQSSRISGDTTISDATSVSIFSSRFGSNLVVDDNRDASVQGNDVKGKLSGENDWTNRQNNRAGGGTAGHFAGPDGVYNKPDA